MLLLILGGLMQIVGFGFVAWELWRVQKHEFGLPAFVRQWRDRNLPERPPPTPVFLDLAPAEGRSGGGLELTTGPAPVVPVEKRLDEIEGDLREMRDKATRDQGAVNDSLNRVREKLKIEETERVREWEAHETARKSFLRESLRMQLYGTILFVLGTILTTLGSLV